MNKILQKNIEKRHKEEQKAREKNEIQRIKDMKKSQKYEEKAVKINSNFYLYFYFFYHDNSKPVFNGAILN